MSAGTPPKPLRICIVTGSRGEYGALRWLMKDLSIDSQTDFKLIVTGSHLLKKFGYTYREIENDGHRIDVRVYSDFDTRSPVSLARANGRWTGQLADVLATMKPDLVIVAGDRYELLAVCSACLFLLIPVAHLSGGEITEGAIDEQIRHAVTKLSHLHFAANAAFATRIKQMGEEPWRVCVSGDPGLDTVRRITMLSKRVLEKRIGLDLSRDTALCTFHPVTLEADQNVRQTTQLLKALDQTPLQYVLTYPNADYGSHGIVTLLKQFAKNHPGTVRLIPNLGQHAYMSLMQHVRMMIGNSSSGIWEAPSFNLPVVNIGNRQKGRLRARNVIDVACTALAIRTGIRKALHYDRSAPCENPYGDGRSSARIHKFIQRTFAKKTHEEILKKKFIGVRT